jgi:hypothetical protein
MRTGLFYRPGWLTVRVATHGTLRLQAQQAGVGTRMRPKCALHRACARPAAVAPTLSLLSLVS